ncbi:hypothetical protein BDZ89DRAFT_1092503 [Hymenopellis radicata]|nr:hypothetical protein BDZ89DRAFT_1092503 [Hymenopellis radicata]
MADLKRSFDVLDQHNWGSFSPAFKALMGIKGYWGFFDGTETAPTFIDPSNLTAAERKEKKDYAKDLAAAAGWIWLYLSAAQQTHVEELQDDPAAMWTTLKGIHQQKRPGNRFNAYEELFNIRKEEDETLTTLVGRVASCMKVIHDLRTTSFTLVDLDNELQSMALLRALPEEYDYFASTLLLLDSLALDKLVAAFHTEETQRKSRIEKALRAAAAAAAYATAHAAATQAAAPAATSSVPLPSAALICGWCSRSGHLEENCFKKAKAKQRAVEDVQSGGNKKWPKKSNGNEKSDRANATEETASAASARVLT